MERGKAITATTSPGLNRRRGRVKKEEGKREERADEDRRGGAFFSSAFGWARRASRARKAVGTLVGGFCRELRDA